MTQIPTTDLWKHWISGSMQRDPTEESTNSICFPIMNPFPPHEWMVFKPFTNTYMIVPNEEYRAQWDLIHPSTRYSPK